MRKMFLLAGLAGLLMLSLAFTSANATTWVLVGPDGPVATEGGDSAAATTGDAPAAPADGFVMDKTGKEKYQVTFNHSTHTTVDCASCHHMAGDAKQYASCAAEGCHDVMDKKDKSVNSYFRAMHGKKLSQSTCISCHKELVKENKELKKPLTGCRKSKCHP